MVWPLVAVTVKVYVPGSPLQDRIAVTGFAISVGLTVQTRPWGVLLTVSVITSENPFRPVRVMVVVPARPLVNVMDPWSKWIVKSDMLMATGEEWRI